MLAALRQIVVRSIAPLHVRLRNRKVDLFLQLARPQLGESLLDVGGGLGIAGEFQRLYGSFSRVTVVNLRMDSRSLPAVRPYLVAADGCHLPFGSAGFDWVFSNAVIEHVGSCERQKLFASEIRRVAAKGYFVTTPNRYFPLDPHTLLPFYQFLPVRVQRRVVRFYPGYLADYEEINLLSSSQLRELFPGAKVCGIGLPLFPNSLMAFFRNESS